MSEIRDDLGLPVVHLKSEMFDAWSIAFFAMPWVKILEVMVTPEERRTPLLIDLLKLSLQNPEKVVDLEILTFRELQEILANWMILSGKLELEQEKNSHLEG